jgi:hypothetical protein
MSRCASCGCKDRTVRPYGYEECEYGTHYIGFTLCYDCYLIEMRNFADAKEDKLCQT